MTVLVGVLCRDGVVVGSDSSATFVAGPGRLTIEQPAQKTFIVGADVILATTGEGGLGQRLEYVLQQLRNNQSWSQGHHLDIAKHISRLMIEDMSFTHLNPGGLGALVAFSCQGGFHLYEFTVANFQPELKTPGMWFVTMGSGQTIADPFFGLLRRTLFRDKQPTLAEGVLAAYWALHNAIHLNTGGINGPVQLAKLSRQAPDAPYEAKLLGEDELAEHGNAVEAVERYLAGYRQQLGKPGASTAETPPQPTPPA